MAITCSHTVQRNVTYTQNDKANVIQRKLVFKEICLNGVQCVSMIIFCTIFVTFFLA